MENSIKSIFCSYRGILIVLDSSGNRIDELCGEVTLEKYNEIQKRTGEFTEYDGKANYEAAVEKLIKEKEEKERKEEKQTRKIPQQPKGKPSAFPPKFTKNKFLNYLIIGTVFLVILPVFSAFILKKWKR